MFKEKWYIFVLLASFIFSFVLAFGIEHPFVKQSDAYGYDVIGFNLATGKGYVNEFQQVIMNREPAYPFFLAAIYLITGRNHVAVRFAQIILFLVTIILTYKIAEMIFDKRVAKYSMILVAFFPTLANYPSYILSETLFTFLLSLFVYFCIKIYLERKLIYYILSGITLGILILCKSAMLPFVLILFLWGISFGKDMPKAILMFLICVIVIFPWMYRNYMMFNTFALREGIEVPLGVKVQKLNYTLSDFKQTIIFTISEGLGKKLFPNAVDKPRDFLFKEDILVREEILPRLIKEGYNNKEIKKMMINKIMKRPIKFLAVSFLDLLRMTQFSYFPILNQPNIIENFKRLPRGGVLLFLLRGVFRSLAYLLIICAIYGMRIKKLIWKKWIFLCIVIIYSTIIYSLIYGHGRYSVPLIPYYIILSVPIILKIKTWIIDKYAKV